MGLSEDEITRLVSDTVQKACAASTHMQSSDVASALTEMAVENILASGEQDPDRIQKETERSIMRIDQEAIRIKERETVRFKNKGLGRARSRLRRPPFDTVIPSRAVTASLTRLWCTVWPFCSPE